MSSVMAAAERYPVSQRYRPPSPETVSRVAIPSLLGDFRALPDHKLRRLPGSGEGVYCVGEIGLLRRSGVAVVGSRKVSPEGAARARRLARELAGNGVVVVSGLAEGVDQNAHQAAIDAGGGTVAVIGTPVDRAYPAKHAALQERIYREHLLISPFSTGYSVQKSSFPERNKLMAAVSDGTCIVEATDTSGSLHQASECAGLGRWLFILKNLVENQSLSWPRKFLTSEHRERVVVVETVDDILRVIR
jgi:DNA processing protein